MYQVKPVIKRQIYSPGYGKLWDVIIGNMIFGFPDKDYGEVMQIINNV